MFNINFNNSLRYFIFFLQICRKNREKPCKFGRSAKNLKPPFIKAYRERYSFDDNTLTRHLLARIKAVQTLIALHPLKFTAPNNIWRILRKLPHMATMRLWNWHIPSLKIKTDGILL